jgi:hypothetical protein
LLSRTIAVVIIVLSTFLASPSITLAQGDVSASQFSFAPVQPEDPAVTEKGYFIYSLKPGASSRGSVRLQNTAKKTVTIELAALDAETAQTGGSSFAPISTKPKAVGTWVRLAERSVTLRSGEQKEVSFSVRAPESVKPGQYLAGITAYAPNKPNEAAKRHENQAGASVDVQTRYVIAVQVNVPGAQIPSLSISSVSLLEQPAGTYIGITMKNDGAVLLKPSGSIVLTDSEGTRVLEKAIKMDTFVTGTETTYPVALPRAVRPGKYSAEVNLSYAKGKAASYNGTIEIKAPESALRPAPQAEGEEGAQQGTSAESTTSGSGQQERSLTSGMQPWIVYVLGGLLLLAVVLLALNLLRGRTGKGTT